MSGSAWFGASLTQSSAQLGSVLNSARYSLFVSKLNVLSPDQLDSEFGWARLSSGLDSARFGSVLMFGSGRLEAELVLARSLLRFGV